ncbi:unnamed protein product [Brachionus calyciflorus]|uniref:Alpha/beta hydrolase fold-3 domain-containing protein n=1 Tax=Brachionus calyciflorus TaxID=104777 RepID=A0A813SRP1_9BILA|nr:unnamed protein product [Brachionus calyciflorus]
MSEQFDLDERMTEETKNFVTSSLKVYKPSDVPKIDVKLSRQVRAANTERLLKTLNFDNLNSREVFVKNEDDDHQIPISIYVPKDVKSDSAITVFYHGGGWTFNSRDSHYFAVATLATLTKTIWVSVEYRLGPEHKFPQQISDCLYALKWVIENKGELGSPNAKIGVSGDSAGGHFAAIMAHEFKQSLTYQVLIYPCVDLITIYDSYNQFSSDSYILTPDLIKFFIGNLLDDADLTIPRASPLFNEDFSNLPKCLIICAELDPLVDQSHAYEKKLSENSIECSLKKVNGTIHGFFHNGHVLKNAFNEAVQHIGEFFQTI